MSETLQALLRRRIDRRRVLATGAGLAAASLVASCRVAETGASQPFAALKPANQDDVRVPDGYSAQTVLRWGDPLFADAPALEPRRVAAGALLARGAAAAQERQFGYNCDGVGLFALDGDDQLLLCVNHEYPVPALLFPGWAEAGAARSLGDFVKAHPEAVAFMQAAVGLSVVELTAGDRWSYHADGRLNRRITANTPIEIAGPARVHPLLNPRGDERPTVLGTLGNCAAGTTPWGTYLTAEENIDDYFGNGAAANPEAAVAEAHRRFGFRMRESAHRWEFADARFDSAANPAESLKFGWVVELDPFDPRRPLKKRTALGRFKHEGATTAIARDGRVAVYTGDDQQFEYFYKFVTDGKFDPARPDANRDLLDAGTLYVARFRDDGRGEWLPLLWQQNPELTPERGFASQADVVLRCRDAADRLGATPMDRPEDVAVNPLTGNVYFSCTQNLDRGSGSAVVTGRQIDIGADAVNPRAPNPSGHIVEIVEEGADAAATGFRWEIFVLAGAPTADRLLAAVPPIASGSLAADATYFGGAVDPAAVSAFANPDNLGFDTAGNLWIVTDGAQPDGNTNGTFVCATAGPDRGRVRQFMSGPLGAEVCGCQLTADDRTLLLTVQHPGEGGSAAAPLSRWPDGGDAAPRPSLVAIQAAGRRHKVGV